MNKESCTLTKPEQMTSLGAAIRECLKEHGTCAVEFGPKKANRSLAQNRLLWLWHGELKAHIEEHQGHIFSTDEIHEHVTEKLLPKKVSVLADHPIIIRAKTSKLKVAEFKDFLDKYQGWAAELYQCYFSQPDDLYYEAMGLSREKVT